MIYLNEFLKTFLFRKTNKDIFNSWMNTIIFVVIHAKFQSPNRHKSTALLFEYLKKKLTT